MKAGVPMTETVSRVSVPKYIRRRPRPMVCSGRMSLAALKARRPTTVVTLRTSQPSLSMSTETMAL